MILKFVLYTVIYQIVIFVSYITMKRYWSMKTLLPTLLRIILFAFLSFIILRLFPGNHLLFFVSNFCLIIIWGAILTFINEKKKAKHKHLKGK